MVSPHHSRSWIGHCLGIVLVWGCSFLFIKLSLGFLSPFGVAFMRYALGALTLSVLLRLTRHALLGQRIV